MVVIAVAVIGGVAWWKHSWDAQHPTEAPTVAAVPARAARPKPTPPSEGGKHGNGAPAGTIEVLVKSNVDGAIISVDGKTDPSWLTPHKVRMELGAHRVNLSKEGYRTSRNLITLTGEEGGLEFRLKPLPGTPAASSQAAEKPAGAEKPAPVAAGDGRLRVVTFPPNADMEVDGHSTNYKTPVNILLAAGRHKITVKHKRTEDYTEQVIVVADKIVELQVNMFNPGKPIPPGGGRP